MQDIMALGLKNIVAATTFCVLLLVALLFLLINTLKGDFNKICLKIFGSLLLVGVMLFADNVFVYSVTPLIIGTLVTDPGFIERITALISKNSDYFKFATEEEHKEKIENEILLDSPTLIFDKENIKKNNNLNPDINTYKKKLNNELQFEKAVLEKIKTESNLIPTEYLYYNIGLYNDKGKKTLFDALVKMPSDYCYVIEIKNVDNEDSFRNSMAQIKESSNILRKYIKKNNSQYKGIKNILIIPENNKWTEDVYDNVAVLKFSINNNSFTNGESVYNWLHDKAL